MSKLQCLLVAVLFLLTAPLSAPAANTARPPVLSALQKHEIVYAYQRGGMRLAAIVYQESSGCVFLRDKSNRLVYGCGHLNINTVAKVVGFPVNSWMLTHDFELNINIAAELLNQCTQVFGFYGGITCYYSGAPAARAMTRYQLLHSQYLATIQTRMMELQAIPVDTE